MKIVVVDDDKENRWGLKRLLEDSGHEVLTAESKDQALGLIHQPPNIIKWQTELVITDLDMGNGTDGFDLIRETGVKHLSVRLWLVSAGMTQEIEVEAKRLGAERALQKSDLLNALRAEKIIS